MLSALVAAMLIQALVGGVARGSDFRPAARLSARSVCTLGAGAANGGVSMGTAFAVADGSILVTNAHVLGDAKYALCIRDDGVQVHAFPIRVDPTADVALLVGVPSLPPLFLHLKEPEVGTPVAALGSPKATGIALSDGIVSAHRPGRSVSYVQHTAPTSPGSSGGPLVLEDGAVVGVISSQLAGESVQNVNYAITSLDVAAQIGLAGIPLDEFAVYTTTPPAGSPPPTVRRAVPSPERHELFDIELGTPISQYPGLKRVTDDTYKAVNANGVPGGILSVTTCQGVVHSVEFRAVWVRPGSELLDARGIVQAADNPAVAAHEFVREAMGTLNKAGWLMVLAEPATPFSSESMFTSDQRLRHLSMDCPGESHLECTATVRALSTQACADRPLQWQ